MDIMSNTPDSSLLIPRKLYRPRTWSKRALTTMVLSFLACVALSVGDGVVSDAWVAQPHNHMLIMGRTWIADLRFLAEQVIYASTILFIGAKFFEQRTVISVGFDRPDSGKMAVMGPDENGYLWVGRKYPSRIEGENAVAALRSGIMQSEEKNFGSFGW
jgi:hypothetical protein